MEQGLLPIGEEEASVLWESMARQEKEDPPPLVVQAETPTTAPECWMDSTSWSERWCLSRMHILTKFFLWKERKNGAIG